MEISKTEQKLILLAERGGDMAAEFAMKRLRKEFDKSYGWCPDCDFLVCKEKDCCLNVKYSD